MFETPRAPIGGLEGIVSKRVDALYLSGRQDSWCKLKCGRSDTFPIIAFVEKLGASPRRVASLYIGRYRDGRLIYAGKVGTGYTLTSARAVREILDPLIQPKSPLSHAIDKPKATWVRPDVLAEVGFSGETDRGVLREAELRHATLAPAYRNQSGMRNSDGTFLPGHSGNPSGRPAIISELQKLARTHTPTALATLVEIMSDAANPPNARVSAAVALLDRGYGRPAEQRVLELEQTGGRRQH